MEKHNIGSGFSWRSFYVSSLLMLCQNGMVYAEGKSNDLDYSTLQGVTVTATRTKRDVFAVPESVSIVDKKQIEAEQATDLADIVENLPNIDIVGGPRSSGQRINIRGLSDQRVLYLMDGARQNFNSAHNSRIFLDPELLKSGKGRFLSGPPHSTPHAGPHGALPSRNKINCAFAINPKAGYEILPPLMSSMRKVSSAPL